MHTSSVQQNILAELSQELASTRRMLERVPFEQADFKPHPKSMSLWQLATHVVNLLAFKTMFLQTDSRDFLDLNGAKPGPAPQSKEELLTRFDKYSTTLTRALMESSDEKLTQNFKLHRGEQVIFDIPKAGAVRIMGLNHSIHHRGQLSVYLRMLDIPVPGLYGPSADEQGGA
jgi:uncharacterized damage-inducible protein DinB